MDKTTFINVIQTDFPHITKEQIDLIITYKELVQEYNQYFNLTRLDTEEKIYQEFLYDSLLPYKNNTYMPIDEHKKIIDIGSGSGIPGVLIAIVFNKYEVSLLEANSKKCSFLETVKTKLNLTNLNILNMRAEDINSKQRESFDLATSRAVAALYKILEISVPFVKVGGYLIEPKGLNYTNEINEAASTIGVLGLEQVHQIDYISNQKTNHILIYTKNKPTNKKYPRTWAQIVQKPL
ncbi:16S rRNA (guanine(527)-N(7))-methyltransferase RsmG [Ureaplasma sp. ES3154-GEN]|uniref:16S rRNA (guanine(527)-N(7))-methyltransferase RsmG n=1 Tax=Ureaplasma sp. ES3154-GEN TaxID=2984844 RepID=UPI0021E89473|nr:16S rRNA (guanine(527)-N(7))-methyltransferase RsmG [Ureaplasma sp. ES3154-GEN]MCV3743464.1 16S rRNA (guanine(527)-N(7))-methyltransferase RsmG [Ureaplasma sp. ES3154-GEN]